MHEQFDDRGETNRTKWRNTRATMKQLYNKLRRGFISRPDVMGNVSLLVLAADVNDLNGGALTANFSRLLRDPVQITLNRPLVSDRLRSRDFSKAPPYTRFRKNPGTDHQRLVGLRLTSTDRRRFIVIV